MCINKNKSNRKNSSNVIVVAFNKNLRLCAGNKN